MQRTSFAKRLQAVYTRWARVFYFLLAIPVLATIALFILQAIGGDLMVRAIYGVIDAILPYFSSLFHGYPYLYVFIIFLLINLLVIIHAYFVTFLPLGLSVDSKYYDSPKYFVIVVSNNTGDNLKECEIELVEMIKLSENTPKSCIEDYQQRTPAKMHWINGNEMIGTTTEIKNGRNGIAGVVYTKKTNDGRLCFGNDLPPLMIWPGTNKAKIHFSGITAKGDTKSKEIFLEINFTSTSDLKVEVSI